LSVALGDLLRNAREAKGMSVEQVAAVTRLNYQFIEAMEEGRWDKLPGQVYLRPFAKTYAEALGLDIKEVYKIIDGIAPETAAPEQPSEPEKRRRDYRLPLVILTGIAIIILIYLVVDFQRNTEVKVSEIDVIPAEVSIPKKAPMWSRPWQSPAEWESAHPGTHRLRLEATDQVWGSVFSGSDTLFAGFINAGGAKTLYSNEQFVINLGRNDCISGYFDGDPVPAIGTTEHGLYNYRLGEAPDKD